MRLTQKKIEEILLDIIGEEGLPLVRQLYGRENISEFELANKTKKDIKIIRRMLYILYNHSLVGFTRKKDKQKGWYIYYWTLLPDGIRFTFLKMKQELLQRLREQLEQEQKELFFVCPGNCIRLNFDQATDFEFHCPECGQLVAPDEMKGKVPELKRRIAEIERELQELPAEKPRRKAVKKKEVKKKAVKKTKQKKTKQNAAKRKRR